MTDTSGHMELIHECNVCRGRFSDEELLRGHVCPAAEGNEFISLEVEPEKTYEQIAPDAGKVIDRMGILTPENAGGEAAIAIGEHAFRAGWAAHAAMVSFAAIGDRSSLPEAITTVEQAWSAYGPPEDIKALV